MGWRTYQERLWKGQRCFVTTTVRTRIRKGWGYFNKAIVKIFDDEGRTIKITSVPLARFNKESKATGRRVWQDSQLVHVVSEEPQA